eukprot:GHVT01033325.1.p1 GENE.GHVT01033325.1~~GHVT01033325.1.p1  ORF type:complete len:121 (+),score=6.26 GHVT01033325.1:459-821(+)
MDATAFLPPDDQRQRLLHGCMETWNPAFFDSFFKPFEGVTPTSIGFKDQRQRLFFSQCASQGLPLPQKAFLIHEAMKDDQEFFQAHCASGISGLKQSPSPNVYLSQKACNNNGTLTTGGS